MRRIVDCFALRFPDPRVGEQGIDVDRLTRFDTHSRPCLPDDLADYAAPAMAYLDLLPGRRRIAETHEQPRRGNVADLNVLPAVSFAELGFDKRHAALGATLMHPPCLAKIGLTTIDSG